MSTDEYVLRNTLTSCSLSDPKVYQSECLSLLTRMIDTVPSNVNLTDEITLLPAKVDGGQLAFERSQLVFKASLRVCSFLYIFNSFQIDFYNLPLAHSTY